MRVRRDIVDFEHCADGDRVRSDTHGLTRQDAGTEPVAVSLNDGHRNIPGRVNDGIDDRILVRPPPGSIDSNGESHRFDLALRSGARRVGGVRARPCLAQREIPFTDVLLGVPATTHFEADETEEVIGRIQRVGDAAKVVDRATGRVRT